MAIYNPFSRSYKVTNSWSVYHRAVDYNTPVGFRFGAPYSGTYYRLPSELSRTDRLAAGVWGELVLADGRRIRFCHLKKHIAANGARVVKGQILGETGNTGYVIPRPTVWRPYNGAHVHTYGLTRAGSRWNWTAGTEKVATGTVAPAKGLNLRTKPSTRGKVLVTIPAGVKLVSRAVSGQWWSVSYKGKIGWVHAAYLK